MMNVKEYATDIEKDVSVVLNKCHELGIVVNNEEDMLGDDDIVNLDGVFLSEHDENDETAITEELEDRIEEEYAEEVKVKKVKKIKKDEVKTEQNNFEKMKKEMYKHKGKLQSNYHGDENIILYKEGMTVGELASSLNKDSAQIMKKLFNLGVMLAINSKIDFDTADIIASDYNVTLKREATQDEANFEEYEIIDKDSDLQVRPPVVTIMGHVDHGKTTLLDAFRETDVVGGEAGGITQHIGAYQINYNNRSITFIDTPGHAAFTEMRARGASVTDIVIIIVAADDGVMPQTKEAIDHAKAANVPIIVAVNKIDRPGANPERIMTEMANLGVTPDIWGGDTMFINISAKQKTNLDELLEAILLTADMQELKANPNRYAVGTVIEAKTDKKTGGVITLLIQNGTLRLGDPIVVGTAYGKVRTLKNDKGENLVEALPAMPVSITGLNVLPSAGDKCMAFETEKRARSVAEQRQLTHGHHNQDIDVNMTMEDLFSKINQGYKEINVILKADVKGSEEAVKNALLKIDVEGAKVKVIRSDVGAITDTDIVLAATASAIIIGFNVRPDAVVTAYAKEKKVEIRLYNIIYKVVEEMTQAMKGILDPEYEEKVICRIEVRKLFKFSKVGTIAGCYVQDGVAKRDMLARIIRDSIVIYEGKVNSLAREKDQVKEVKNGLECGITIENYNDLKPNDIIEGYEMVLITK